MEVSALKYSGGIGLHARTPLLRLQSDERLVAFVRRGNPGAFEALVSRYECRLLSFCRHMLGSREDAEDVLQEVLAAAYNAILADTRPINVRPWLYRIARNRSLNHLRRSQAIGMDSMDVHFFENGQTTADKAHDREEFRLLVGDIHDLPETQRTALVLREMDALSYEQIAEAMETTVPSVKSLLVRARVSLAEAAESRLLSCDEVRVELGEVAEGLRRRPSPLVRRHLKACKRCSVFRTQLKETNRALAAFLPIGPLVVLKKLALTHAGHSASSGATGAGATTAAAGSTAAAGGTLVAGGTAGGFVSAGIGAIATKAAAGLAAAALVTAGAMEVDHSARHLHHHISASVPVVTAAAPAAAPSRTWDISTAVSDRRLGVLPRHDASHKTPRVAVASKAAAKPVLVRVDRVTRTATTTTAATTTATTASATTPVTAPPPPGQTLTQTDPTVLAPSPATTTAATTTTTTTTTGTTTTTTSSTLPPGDVTTAPTDSAGPGVTGTTPPSGGAAPVASGDPSATPPSDTATGP